MTELLSATIFVSLLASMGFWLIEKFELKNHLGKVGMCDLCLAFWLNVAFTFLSMSILNIFITVENYMLCYMIVSPFAGTPVTKFLTSWSYN